MGSDLYCPDCGENLGKDTENPKKAWCGRCGNSFINQRGRGESTKDTSQLIGKIEALTRKSAMNKIKEKFDKDYKELGFKRMYKVKKPMSNQDSRMWWWFIYGVKK